MKLLTLQVKNFRTINGEDISVSFAVFFAGFIGVLEIIRGKQYKGVKKNFLVALWHFRSNHYLDFIISNTLFWSNSLIDHSILTALPSRSASSPVLATARCGIGTLMYNSPVMNMILGFHHKLLTSF